MGTTPLRPRPSRIWIFIAAPAFVLAAAFIGGAITVQRDATRPVGEGQLFQADAAGVAAEVADAAVADIDRVARHARNRLNIEAVTVVDGEGRYLASTSDTLAGGQLPPGLLGFALQNGRFAAVATPSSTGIMVDGVEEWPAGATLYAVLQPLPTGGGALLHYDVAELLGRRARPSGIQAATLQLGAIGFILLAIGVTLLAARRVSGRRIRDTVREAQELAARSRQLERHNAELDEARVAAERALALAEETNRIRSEFVLMINHELRTPLTSVVTGAEVLRSGIVADDEADQVLDNMVRDGRRLHELIAQILNVARIENRGLNFKLAAVPVADVLARVEARSPAAVESGPDDRRSLVRCDVEGLSQLLASLTDNALVHGARTVSISTAAALPFVPHLEVGSPCEGNLYFLVTDDGSGIDREFLPRAFEKFEKQSFDSGTGLGLYLARLMIEAMDGCIAVHTGSDGTTMAVGVPLAAVTAEVVV